MAAVITNYIESILNPDTHLRTLKNFDIIKDKYGMPVFTQSELTVDFEIIFNGRHYIVRCLGKEADRLHTDYIQTAMFTSGIRTEFVMPMQYLQKEMMITDSSGTISYCNVMLEEKPAGVRLTDVLPAILMSGKREALTAIMLNLIGLERWMIQNEFSHGKLSGLHIFVRTDCTLCLSNYSRSSRGINTNDLKVINSLLLLLYSCTHDDKRTTAPDTSTGKNIKDAAQRLIEESEGLQDNLFANLKQNIAHCEDADYNYCELLGGIEKYLAPLQIGETVELDLGSTYRSAPAASEKSAHHNRFTFIGIMHDMLTRVCDGDFWFYVDGNGSTAIEGGFIEATDFEEGRAVVRTENGYALIDTEGRYILQDKYDYIDWNCSNNVAVVILNGLAGLYTRSGKIITGHYYDAIYPNETNLMVASKDGRYGIIDTSGHIVHELVYDNASVHKDGFIKLTLHSVESCYAFDGELIEKKIPDFKF